jgi:hypothetical protein
MLVEGRGSAAVRTQGSPQSPASAWRHYRLALELRFVISGPGGLGPPKGDEREAHRVDVEHSVGYPYYRFFRISEGKGRAMMSPKY